MLVVFHEGGVSYGALSLAAANITARPCFGTLRSWKDLYSFKVLHPRKA
jgi:hypothetical protein